MVWFSSARENSPKDKSIHYKKPYAVLGLVLGLGFFLLFFLGKQGGCLFVMGWFGVFLLLKVTSIVSIPIFREAFGLCTDLHNLKRLFTHDGRKALALVYSYTLASSSS